MSEPEEPPAAFAGRGFPLLLVAQFFSAFADNAILFAVVAMVRQHPELPGWYIPALQSAFLVAFVVLAPWVGLLADCIPKPRVLLLANGVKATGTLFLLAGLEPVLAYGVVGAGAALYSPAKYGILPEMAPAEKLVKANGWIEGATILAIVLGPLAGAKTADAFSIALALGGILGLYLFSGLLTLWLPRLTARRASMAGALRQFSVMTVSFLRLERARFAILGGSLFWATAATLRMILIAWAPLALGLQDTTDIAALTLFLAIGIVFGAALAPRLIPLRQLRRARWAAYLLAIFVLLLAGADNLWLARGILLCIGMAGGTFVVPINAALQDVGHRSVGGGGAVAIQRFAENVSMLLAVGLYTFAASRGVEPVLSLLGTGVLVVLATFWVSLKLPETPQESP